VVHVRWPEGAKPHIEINNDMRRVLVAYDLDADAGADAAEFVRVELETPA